MTFLVSGLLALAVLQQESHATHAARDAKAQAATSVAEVPKAFAQLPTMQRMLQQKLQEKRREIGPEVPQQGWARGASAGGGPGAGSGSGGGDTSVANDFYGRVAGYEVAANTHAEYVPGLAAIFSLNAAVRTELVEETKEKKSDADPTSGAKSDDDMAWEAASHNESQDAAKRLLDLARDNKAHAGSLRFTQSSVDVLENTLLDTIWRFGHKLELARGERLAVVVDVQPAMGYGSSTYSPAGIGAPAGASGSGEGTVADPNSNFPSSHAHTFWSVNANPPASFRLVIQVSADDLAAYHAGTLERDDLAKRTLVQRYAVPNRSLQYGLGFWSNSAK